MIFRHQDSLFKFKDFIKKLHGCSAAHLSRALIDPQESPFDRNLCARSRTLGLLGKHSEKNGKDCFQLMQVGHGKRS